MVQAGETLATIAARYGSSVDEIVTATGLENPDLIYRGQVLTVPLPSAGAAQEADPILIGAKESMCGYVDDVICFLILYFLEFFFGGFLPGHFSNVQVFFE